MSQFFTFSGVDGSGKTTQAKMLMQWLSRNGYLVHLHDPMPIPSYFMLERVARRQNVASCRDLFGAEPIELLLMADVLRHIEEFVLPHNQRGGISITTHSVIKRLAAATFQDCRNLELLRSMMADFYAPHLHIIMDITPGEAEERVLKRGYDREDYMFLDSARQTILRLGPTYGERVLLLDARRPRAELHATIIDAVQQSLGRVDIAPALRMASEVALETAQ
jgi:dTMP kinase